MRIAERKSSRYEWRGFVERFRSAMSASTSGSEFVSVGGEGLGSLDVSRHPGRRADIRCLLQLCVFGEVLRVSLAPRVRRDIPCSGRGRR